MQNPFFPISYHRAPSHPSRKGIYVRLASVNCSVALLPTGDKYTSSSLGLLRAGGLMGAKEEQGSMAQGGDSSY